MRSHWGRGAGGFLSLLQGRQLTLEEALTMGIPPLPLHRNHCPDMLEHGKRPPQRIKRKIPVIGPAKPFHSLQVCSKHPVGSLSLSPCASPQLGVGCTRALALA